MKTIFISYSHKDETCKDRFKPHVQMLENAGLQIKVWGGKGGVYDFMLFFNPYIEIFLQEIKTFREKHKIIDVPFIP
jgi:hypothetical protein